MNYFPATYVYGESEFLTISFPVVINSVYGFITSGHMAELAGGAGSTLTMHGDSIGQILGILIDEDAAFCSIDRGKAYINSKIRNAIPLPSICHEAPDIDSQQGIIVDFASPYHMSTGRIRRGDVAVSYLGYDDKRHYIPYGGEATYLSYDRDCGGVVYDESGIYGIHVGAGKLNDLAYYSQVMVILRAFGASYSND